MKQKCFVCNKYFTKIVQHLQRSKCIEIAKQRNALSVPMDIAFPLHLNIPKTWPMLWKNLRK